MVPRELSAQFSHLSCLTLRPHGLVCQVPLSMKFSRQEYWSGLPFPSPRDLADPGIEPVSLVSPLLAGRFFTMWGTREARGNINQQLLPNDSILSWKIKRKVTLSNSQRQILETVRFSHCSSCGFALNYPIYISSCTRWSVVQIWPVGGYNFPA